MQVKGPGSDVLCVSVSNAPSTSSHGSTPDDYDALVDVYIWGEVICDSVAMVLADKNTNYLSTRADRLLPRPLESNIVLDIHDVTCGVKHAALVTMQGEVFTGGEESGGRLSHGVGKEVIQPHLVESLAITSVGLVACGQFHTCTITMAGELYTWGDRTHNAGLLGHGSDVSHWIPKKSSGSLEGLQVASRKCFISQRSRVSSGLRTIAVACGVWHTAAVVEVIVTQSTISVSSGKLFTHGMGTKIVLDMETRNPGLSPRVLLLVLSRDLQESELQKSTKRAEEAVALAAEESVKSEAAKEVTRSITAQLKDMAERLPPGVCDTENIKPAYVPNGLEKNGVHYADANGIEHLRSDSIGGSFLASASINGHSDTRLLKGTADLQAGNISVSDAVDERESGFSKRAKMV
ncbi:Regulator of chromosome condensation (RCC1) family with FYVE zinc finger domain isoform 3 [Hibiscus syriacus]|uniref:Regulator of chromosome condensation (RCC1) family with FYVE zinc finger domain isoform 3 n=1 Tax=Hibiscus syriacus TaxID=106335 RepID=A0A6A2WV81_HIBSY|nr:Regulator of chromosome condensation (RCC1) family with FYVE zinc finger domain isoform 3 [Hibiscus syriacus]